MSERQVILAWAERGAIADPRAALRAAAVLPDAGQWRRFLDLLLLWSGVAAFGAAVVFFLAYNWNELGRFAKFGLVEVLIVAAVVGYWRFGPERAAGKASLLLAALLLGALMALFGQTYQTGADPYELFANWAALILPWVLVGRFAALWVVWIALVNVAIVLYFVVFPGLFGIVFSTERELWTLFGFNTIALVLWELAALRLPWLDERWAARLLALASGSIVTALMLLAIFDWSQSGGAVVLAYPLWLAGAYWAYRRVFRDLFVLAGGCLSVIVTVTVFLGKHLMARGSSADATLFIALVVIGMAAAAGWWLKRIAAEVRS